MPYITCDEACCDEKAWTGHDCHGDHWVPDPPLLVVIYNHGDGARSAAKAFNGWPAARAFVKTLPPHTNPRIHDITHMEPDDDD